MLLNKQVLSLAALASREESRFTLKAILVTQKECVVTDGHQLTRITLPDDMKVESFPDIPGTGQPANGDLKPFLLPTKQALEIAKALPAKSTIPILEQALVTVDDKGKPQIVVTDLESYRVWKPNMPGNFPDWERVLPKPEDAEFRISLSAELLDRVLTQAIHFHKLAGNRDSFCTFTFHGPNQPMRIDVDACGQEFMSIIMPGKLERDEDSVYRQRKEIEAAAIAFVENAVSGTIHETLERLSDFREQLAAIRAKKQPVRAPVSAPVPSESPEEEDGQDRCEVIPITRPQFRIAGADVYDGTGQRIAHIESPDKIGVSKQYAGDASTLRAAIRAALEKEPPAAGDRSSPNASRTTAQPAAVPLSGTRPPHWDSMSPADKAWWTRRHGAAAPMPSPRSKAPSIRQQIAELTELLKQKAVETATQQQEAM